MIYISFVSVYDVGLTNTGDGNKPETKQSALPRNPRRAGQIHLIIVIPRSKIYEGTIFI